MEAESGRATHVPKHTLDQPEVTLTRIVHVEADLLDGVGDLRPRDRQVLERAGNTVIGRGIINAWSIGGRQFALGVDRRGRWAAGVHAGAIQDVGSVLLLAEEEASRRARDVDAEEEMQGAKVLHGKLRDELSDDVAEGSRRGRSEHDIVDVEEQEGDVVAVATCKQRRVGPSRGEANGLEEAGEAEEPCTRACFKP